ncbi:ATP-binding protein [Flavobacterium sp. '19STA2R22 D10 B1']|uniref:ATP-binding protein n=1 Tax=Flavobacterium aerium TaxID=3037261 RepID=UPI00278C6DA5|nr:ATP-binding protein [Flavobacterium sp. '19STA2R22 D10 B1']
MKRLIYIVFIGLLIFASCSKKKAFNDIADGTDSLSLYLKWAKADSLTKDERIRFNGKAYDFLMVRENDSFYRRNLFKVANRYYDMTVQDKYENVVNFILEKSIKAKDTASIARSYEYLGNYYKDITINDSAYLYYYKAEKLYAFLRDEMNVGKMHLNKAYVQYSEGDFQGCEISAFKALSYFKNSNDYEMVYEIYNLLGIVYNDLREFDKAIEYHNKALNYVTDKNIDPTLQLKAKSLNNIGVLYKNMEAYKKALNSYKIALQGENLKVNQPVLYAMLLDNLGYAEFKLNETKELPDLFYKALSIRDSLQISPGIIINKIHLSEYYESKNDTIVAKRFAFEAYDLSKETNSARDVLLSLKQLNEVNPVEGANYSKEYIKISDSLQLVERKVRNKLARIEFETNELVVQKEKLEKENRNILFWSGIVTILGILLFVIRYQRTRNKELEMKQTQQKANEEIYNLLLFQQDRIEEVRQGEKKRIAQELHDGILGRLFGTRLNLDSLNKRQDESAIKDRNNYITELKSIEEDIREISHDLNTETNYVTNNFLVIINNLIEQQEKLSNTDIVLRMDKKIQWETVDNAVKINLYRILQEAFQNINKYAKAKKITVEITKKDATLNFVISDDGQGFDTNKKNKGIGLQNMKHRTESINGDFGVKSKVGEGTIITICVPLRT